jgi:ABC-type transport system involved in multi-copper enzyme maturation permease subunit
VVAGVLTNDKASLTGSENQLGVMGIGILAPLIALIMGLIVSTGEFRHGTITPTLLSTPSRPLVVVSKGIAAMMLGVGLVALAEGLLIGEMTALLPLRGIGFALQGDDVARVLVRILAAAAIWGAIGSALGLALRNQIGTFVGCFAWLFFAEPILQGILGSKAVHSSAGRFLPLSSTIAIFNDSKDNNSEMLGHWAGVTVLSGWMLLATIVALVLLRRRDVS